jgi:hypothetical protein
MATWVKWQHVTNKKRTGECSKDDWDKKAKGTNLKVYFKIIETFDKPDFVPDEAKAAAKAAKLAEKNEKLGNFQNIENNE